MSLRRYSPLVLLLLFCLPLGAQGQSERATVTGTVTNADSDNDDEYLLVEFNADEKSFDNFIRLTALLEDALQRQVEVVTPEALSPYIGPHILKEVEYVSLAD